MSDKKQLHLGLSMRGLGYHPSGWHDPRVPADGAINFPYYLYMTQLAERGLFDLVFLADQNSVTTSDNPPGAFGRTPAGAEFEPLTLLAALSALTRNVGLVATASTTFHQPYQLARQFGSIDHLSGGRAGWNVVTSSRDSEAQNFGQDKIMPKDDRYRRAKESLDVCFGLWESWESDAFVHDRKSGIFFDKAKMHPVDHVGEFFRVKGPLNQPPSPQGRPIIVQAGASEGGMDFAANYADLIYSVQNKLEDARDFYAGIKARVAAVGRNPEHVKIMPGILAVIGDSRAEAQDRYEAMTHEIDDHVGLERLWRYFGDLRNHDLDGPVPELRTDIPVISRGELQVKLARENNWSIRQLFQKTAIGHSHHVVVGTPSQIVDVMERWVCEGAADGFNVLPAKQPGDVQEFVERIVPELQDRGLFRTRYAGPTLRENLGLPAYVSRHLAVPVSEDA